MTPQERQLVDDLFDRLAKVENAPRDPEASAAIAQGLRNAPNAVYALVQTVLLQDEALKRANGRIQELEQAAATEQNRPSGFLDSMRETIFGQSPPRGSVPNVPPPAPARPVWNSGQAMQQSQAGGGYAQGPYGQNQGPYGQQAYGAPQGAFGGSPFGGGGSFLGTAAAAAAGMVGGSLLLNGIRSMMGGHHYGVADAGGLGNSPSNPWSDQSDSALARDAGINDIGSSGQHDDGGGRAGFFDTASNDDSNDDEGDFDQDSGGFDGDSSDV